MKPSILIVDDHEEILEFLLEELAEHYAVHTCSNGLDALQLLEQEPIQLVVSDVMMPGMDGFELCRQIKGNFAISHIPVILLTAQNTLQSKIEGLEMGADTYIEKPFSPAHLQAQIASLLRNRTKVQEYVAQAPLAQAKPVGHNKADQMFLNALHEAIEAHLANPDFDVEQLARLLNMSRPTLYRKIKDLSSVSPSDLITITRLKKAAALMNEGSLKLYEVSYLAGFQSQNNFCRSFLKQYGMTPRQYMAQAAGKKAEPATKTA
jgi:DNA-binding response OmpR family regulator